MLRMFPHINLKGLKEYQIEKFEKNQITENCPYVKIENISGDIFYIAKKKLVWLLSNTTTKLSSDRLIRVMAKRT